ncbi:MAG TPA: ParB/RepB/Spo0J family partition protein [Bryobacteraceae bacterium]|nr:ParB/RepB/Spo0J family partition protein [Bryobacteraceae bacterium]
MSTPVLQTSASVEIGAPRYISIGYLVESPRNPRQYYPDAKQRELVQSIREGGFRPWMALVVCPMEGSDDFEVLAGNRRRRAADEAGLPAVPCFVREGLTEEQKLDILNFDNSGREDVHPLDEAAGWRDWMKTTGKGVADIAARIGQSKEYVYQRLKYASLTDDARKAFLDGEITAGHAILIARLEPPAQAKALKFALQKNYEGSRPTVRELAQSLEREVYVDMEGCPFDRGDRTLVAGAGDCESCPKRAANIPGFEFDFDPEFESAPDLCTDAVCYKHKTTNHLFRIRTDLEAKGKTVLSVNSSYGGKTGKGVLKRDQYELAKVADKYAQTALVVDGPDVGEVIHIRVKKEPSAESVAALQKREQEQREKASAEAEKERGIRRRILVAVLDKVTTIELSALRDVLAARFADLWGNDDCDAPELCEIFSIEAVRWQEHLAIEEWLRSATQLQIAKFIAATSVMEDFGGAAQSLMALAKRYKIDPLKIRREVEKELGTAKEVEKPAKSKAAKPAKKLPSAVHAAKKAAKKKAVKK